MHHGIRWESRASPRVRNRRLPAAALSPEKWPCCVCENLYVLDFPDSWRGICCLRCVIGDALLGLPWIEGERSMTTITTAAPVARKPLYASLFVQVLAALLLGI